MSPLAGAHICVGPGSINMDLKLTSAVLPGAKTFSGHYTESQGGKGFDQAVVIRRLSNGRRTVYLLGAVGRDAWGEEALATLKREGVRLDFVQVSDDCRTGVALEYVYGDGQVTVALDLGANSSITTASIDQARDVITSAALLMTQLESPMDVVTHALDLARSHAVVTFLDPSIPPTEDSPRQRLFDEILPRVDILAPNRSEAELLTGVAIPDLPAARAAGQLLLQRVAMVVMTLGKEGALVARDGHLHHVPAPSVTSVDAAAAGDTFRGAFCEALVSTIEGKAVSFADLELRDVLSAVQFANAAAALCTTKAGTYESLPMRYQLDGFVAPDLARRLATGPQRRVTS
jgi:ribokinase